MARRDDGPALVIHVVPLKRAAHEIFSGGDVPVVINEVVTGGEARRPTFLRGLFDLTPAEARIAASLASGQSLREAADSGGIKFSTGGPLWSACSRRPARTSRASSSRCCRARI